MPLAVSKPRRSPASRARAHREMRNNLVLGLHANGKTSGEIAWQLEVLFGLGSWTKWDRQWSATREIARWLSKRGRVPNEAWAEAERENLERTATAARKATERQLQIEEAIRQARRSRAALKALSRRLARAGRRIDRLRQHASSQARREARDCKRAARRATLDANTIAAEVAKAANARDALRDRGDAFLRRAGPLVLAMRAHNRAFPEIAAALEARGIKTARGGPWTGYTASSVAQRLHARMADGDGFHVEPEEWAPAPVVRHLPAPWDDPAKVAFREAEARYHERRVAEETARVEAKRCALAAVEAERLERASAKVAARDAKRVTKDAARVQADIARATRATIAAASKAAAVRDMALPSVMELRSAGRTLDEVALELTRRGVVRAHGGQRWGKAAVSLLLRHAKIPASCDTATPLTGA